MWVLFLLRGRHTHNVAARHQVSFLMRRPSLQATDGFFVGTENPFATVLLLADG